MNIRQSCLLFIAFLAINTTSLLAQDTLNIIYYNILNFPNPSNSDPDGSDAARSVAFREIVEEADADIIVVEELKSSAGADILLTELNNNTQGKTFARAPLFFGYGGNNLGNMLFYNSNLVSFLQQDEVPRNNTGIAPDGNVNVAPRANSYYEVEIFSPSNPADKDKLHLFAGHFKSSNTNGNSFTIPDDERRVLSAKDMMDYIAANIPTSENIIAGGDFNFYSYTPAQEPAYDTLVNPVSYPMNFIDKLGPWTREDSSPSNVCQYTQSTRTAQGEFGNGGASGGLDDRFDFILINDALDLGLNKTKYINNSYLSFGNAKVLDGAATDGTSPVKNQLHQMSDHYPVIMGLELNFSLDCLITGTTTTAGSCAGTDFSFDVSFTAGNASGSFEVIDLSNGNTIIGTGSSSPITVTLPNSNSSTPFNFQVRDANDITCVGEILTMTPINCSSVCAITINSVNTICQTDDTYDLEVCFDYQNPTTSDVNIFVEGQQFGPFPYPAMSGDCITIPSATLGLLGDASSNINLRIEENVTSSGVIGEPFISEFHYDNVGDDVEEFVEITAPAGTDLSLYFLEFYNGNGGTDYLTQSLTGIVPDLGNGCGAVDFLIAGIQNGPDAIALVKQVPTVTVLEFISYEGAFIATSGSANGLTCTDIGVSEPSDSNIGESLQKTDSGWVGPIPETPSALNAGLTICGIGTGVTCFDATTYNEPDCVTPNCMINVAQVNTTCLGDNTYDVEVCFTYQDPISSNVEILIAGTSYGLYAYPATSGGCITISGTTLGLLGDGTSGMTLDIIDGSSSSGPAGLPFISEIHYDNASTDVGEFVEVSAPVGTDLSLYELVAYEESDGASDATVQLTGVIGDDGIGCGAMAFTVADIGTQFFENGTGGADGYALVEIATQTVIEFISYEGTITATNGPALGLTSTDIGVGENSGTAAGSSLKKEDAGWVVSTDDSPGVFNMGLSSCGGSGVQCSTSTTYNEPTCTSSCPANLVENGTSIMNGIYQVSNNIQSAGSVSNGGNVTFDAGVDIDLLPGFCVPLGAEFHGFINGCTPVAEEEAQK